MQQPTDHERIEALEADYLAFVADIGQQLTKGNRTQSQHGRDLSEIKARLGVVETRMGNLDENLKERREDMSERFGRMEASQKTLEEHMLSAFRKMLSILDERLPPKPQP